MSNVHFSRSASQFFIISYIILYFISVLLLNISYDSLQSQNRSPSFLSNSSISLPILFLSFCLPRYLSFHHFPQNSPIPHAPEQLLFCYPPSTIFQMQDILILIILILFLFVFTDRMPLNKYFFQKSLFASVLTALNTLLISLAYTFSASWFLVQLPLLLILLFNLCTVVLSLLCSLAKPNKRTPFDLIPPTTLAYFIPCYNESLSEIQNTMESFYTQERVERHRRFYFVVCDGRKRGKGNAKGTDRIVKEDVFGVGKGGEIGRAYLGAEGEWVGVEVLWGRARTGDLYFSVIKERNQGKRDSIALARRLFYAFNNQSLSSPASTSDHLINPALLSLFTSLLRAHNIFNIQFLVGVDADTVFEPDCTIELLSEITRKPTIMATSGMVKVEFTPFCTKPREFLWQLYQHVQYLAGQGFLRNQQNLTQQKLNCLPGCLNITRVCQETCGQLLLSQYMLPPQPTHHIFQQIRATASQDRHSVMLLLKHHPHAYTTVNWRAQARTTVPTTLSVFLSQRRRWSLGSATHGSWMIVMPNIPVWQRFSSLIFVVTYVINPFLMYSLVTWLSILVSGRGDTMYWVITGVVQVVTLWKLAVPLWCRLTWGERWRYWVGYVGYVVAGPLMGVMVLGYSMYWMDDFGWGKTRAVQEDHVGGAGQEMGAVDDTTMAGMLGPKLVRISQNTSANTTGLGLDTTKPFLYQNSGLHETYSINQLTPRLSDISNVFSDIIVRKALPDLPQP